MTDLGLKRFVVQRVHRNGKIFGPCDVYELMTFLTTRQASPVMGGRIDQLAVGGECTVVLNITEARRRQCRIVRTVDAAETAHRTRGARLVCQPTTSPTPRTVCPPAEGFASTECARTTPMKSQQPCPYSIEPGGQTINLTPPVVSPEAFAALVKTVEFLSEQVGNLQESLAAHLEPPAEEGSYVKRGHVHEGSRESEKFVEVRRAEPNLPARLPVVNDPGSEHHGRVNTDYLTGSEIHTAVMHSVFLSSGDGRGSVPADWINRIREKHSKASAASAPPADDDPHQGRVLVGTQYLTPAEILWAKEHGLLLETPDGRRSVAVKRLSKADGGGK